MQYNIKNILQSGEKVAVHVPTELETREVVKILVGAGQNINPLGRDGTSGIEYWFRYSENTCITLTSFSPISYYEARNYTIIPASLFIQHNTPKVEKKPFAVKADSFELYERFVKECDKIGWRLCKAGSSWLRDALHKKYVIGFGHVEKQPKTWSIYNLEHSNPFSIHYHLETQYPEAIAAAKAWFEGDEVNAITDNSEIERLRQAIKDANNKIFDLETRVKLLLKHNKDQHDRNNSKLMAVSILLSSFPLQATHRQKQFAVDCIKQHINELIEKEYDEPGALPF